jgi:GDP-D-mannose dehydratase
MLPPDPRALIAGVKGQDRAYLAVFLLQMRCISAANQVEGQKS